jgi:hypothetical protein
MGLNPGKSVKGLWKKEDFEEVLDGNGEVLSRI